MVRRQKKKKPYSGSYHTKFKPNDISETCLHVHHLGSDMTGHPAHRLIYQHQAHACDRTQVNRLRGWSLQITALHLDSNWIPLLFI